MFNFIHCNLKQLLSYLSSSCTACQSQFFYSFLLGFHGQFWWRIKDVLETVSAVLLAVLTANLLERENCKAHRIHMLLLIMALIALIIHVHNSRRYMCKQWRNLLSVHIISAEIVMILGRWHGWGPWFKSSTLPLFFSAIPSSNSPRVLYEYNWSASRSHRGQTSEHAREISFRRVSSVLILTFFWTWSLKNVLVFSVVLAGSLHFAKEKYFCLHYLFARFRMNYYYL